MTRRDPRIDALIETWFGPWNEDGEVSDETMKRWFAGGESFDEELRRDWSDAAEEALAGELDEWAGDERGGLALILLLDQITRNIFRGSPRAFSGDCKAVRVAWEMVDAGLDRELPPLMRAFVYMPFMHAESIEAQRRGCDLFQELAAECLDAPERIRQRAEEFYDYQLAHTQIVERFGRFPHRNSILGRQTTTEEEEFLSQPGSSF